MIADKEDRVLTATVAGLAKEGFEVLTATIATRAGVGTGTLFRTFATKELLVAATYPYVLAQLTLPLPEQTPRPGETLRAVLARWWEGSALAALAQPDVFACWRLWRGSARAVPGLRYGPFAGVRALFYQALGDSARSGLQVLAAAVVPGLAAQWLVAVEQAQLGLRGPGSTAPADALPLLRQLYAAWWRSTGLADTLAAVPAAAIVAQRASLAAVLQRAGAVHSPEGPF